MISDNEPSEATTGAPPPSEAQVAAENAGDRKVFVKTFGCQMNVYDSERMTELLAGRGFRSTSSIEDADLVVLNTCHIREKAVEKLYSELGRVNQVKELREAEGKSTLIAVTGCVAQAEGAEITARAPQVDVVVGPQSYHHLPDLLATAERNRAASRAAGFNTAHHVVDTEFPDEDKFALLPMRTGRIAGSVGDAVRMPKPSTKSLIGRSAAFLTVQEGCDKFCTFCVVPYTRGSEFSRPVIGIVDEARRLVEQGVREITLLGQNVNAFHGEGPDGKPWSLARLLYKLADIDGLDRLRYMTSHPRDMGADLIAAHGDLPKLMPYLHLPFQAGSDRILAAMNRKHTALDYLVLVERIRHARTDIALSTDVIVGFPGESEGEFEATLDIIRTVGFAQAYSFKYSPRAGTPAASMDHQLPAKVASERLDRLQALLAEQQATFNAGCVGKIFPVLFEKPGRMAGQLVGRSPYLQLVHAPAASSMLGQILPVEISAVGRNSLAGVLCPA